jgi:hypothetical protein
MIINPLIDKRIMNVGHFADDSLVATCFLKRCYFGFKC